MTTNIDRAAEVIHYHHDNCLDAANALANEGLITPDLDSGLSHTVVAQAETIQTLSQLLAGAEAAATERAEQIERLLREIEALRKAWAAPDDPADDYGRGMEAAYQIAADDLTRILEGDTDE